MRMNKLKNILLLILLLSLVAVAFYFKIIVIKVGSSLQEIKTDLIIDKYIHLRFKSLNEEYTLDLIRSPSSKSLILPKDFNITFIYVYPFLETKEESPIIFIYIPRMFLVLHVVFPNGSEVAFGNFIVGPWSSGYIGASFLRGYKEERVYEPYYENEMTKSNPINPLGLHFPFVSYKNLTNFVHNLISKYDSFSILVYAPSSFTVLNKTQFQIVYDSCISRLDFKNLNNNSVMLNVTSFKPDILGTYKLVYDQETLERRGHDSIAYSLHLDSGATVLLTLVFLVIIFYSYKKSSLAKILLILGIALFAFGFFQLFNFTITHVNGVKMNIFFYSYLTDGNLSYPLEVMWHLSRTISNGTKVAWNFNPNKIGCAFLVGYDCSNLLGLEHRTNPKPTDSIFNGLADTYVHVNLYNSESIFPCSFNTSHTSWILNSRTSTSYTQILTMPLSVSGENKELTFEAGASILAVWSGQNVNGGYIEENLKLCEIKIKKEGNHTLIESFYLPAAYIQPSADVVEEAKEFEQMISLLLELAGSILMLVSIIKLNKQEHFLNKALNIFKEKLTSLRQFGISLEKLKLQH